MPEISVVILCYKAGRAVPAFAQRVKDVLDRIGRDWEIVLVGNHNAGDDEDTTPEVVRALAAADPRMKALTLVKRGMMGWDARTGLEAATGRVIVLIDGDSQMPPEDIERVYRLLVDENLDMAMTYRATRLDSPVRRVNSRFYNLVFALLFPGYPIRDVNSKPKAMTRELYDRFRLTADDWFLDAEIMIQARRHKARLGQLPTVFLPAMDRRSFVKLGAVLQFVKNLLRARLREFFARP